MSLLKNLFQLPFQLDPGNPGLMLTSQALNTKIHTGAHDFPVRAPAGMWFAQTNYISYLQRNHNNEPPFSRLPLHIVPSIADHKSTL